MDNDTIRRRGWSIHSEATHATDENGSLNADEKRALLNNFPSMDDDYSVGQQNDHHNYQDQNNNKTVLQLASHDDEDSSGDDEMVQNIAKSNDSARLLDNNNKKAHPPPRKRRKLEDGVAENIMRVENTSTSNNVHTGVTKLSKWACRLFDPDRPRGVLQPPQTIPLNDEFLSEFGKREKAFDSLIGRQFDVDQAIADDPSDNNDDEDREEVPSVAQSSKGLKLKIANLAFSTTSASLEKACAQYGPLRHVHLVMDKEKDNVNTGRAYVTFETEESATACMEKLTKLDGRSLRISLAAPDPNPGKRSVASVLSRYWERDISTKCHRCGQVGHMESECPNEAIPKPCPLCAKRDHDMRDCPIRQFCFNCGIPGHVSRECPQQRGQGKRMVCGICFQTGHHRVGCWRHASEAFANDAICMVCNREGHFTCKGMKWFFGLEGVSCFNCGMAGHTGYDCQRPGLDACSRDDSVAQQEIDTAEANSLLEELERQKNRGRERVSSITGNSRDRSQSQPPRQLEAERYSERNNNNHGRRFSTSPPPRSRQESRGYQGKHRGYR